MNTNENHFVPANRGTIGLAAREEASAEDDLFRKRIELFDRCCLPGPVGISNVLRLVAADLFRTIPRLEDDTIDELLRPFEKGGRKPPALGRYVRTLRVLRGSLQALETLSAMSVQSQNTKRDQS